MKYSTLTRALYPALAVVGMLLAVACSTVNIGDLDRPEPIIADPGDQTTGLVVSAVTPETARHGETVVITGENLTAGTVLLDGFELETTNREATAITVVLPDWFLGGTLSVSTPDGESAQVSLPWRADPGIDAYTPVVTGCLPRELVPGEPLLIRGEYLMTADEIPRVYLARESLEVIQAGADQLLVTCPLELDGDDYSLTVVNAHRPGRAAANLGGSGNLRAGTVTWQVDNPLPADLHDFLATGNCAVGLSRGALLLDSQPLEHEELYDAAGDGDGPMEFYIGQVDLTGREGTAARLILLVEDGIITLGNITINPTAELIAPRLDRPATPVTVQPGGYLTLTGQGLQDGSDSAPQVWLGNTELEVLTWWETAVTARLPEDQPAGISALDYSADRGHDFLAVQVDAGAEPLIPGRLRYLREQRINCFPRNGGFRLRRRPGR